MSGRVTERRWVTQFIESLGARVERVELSSSSHLKIYAISASGEKVLLVAPDLSHTSNWRARRNWESQARRRLGAQ